VYTNEENNNQRRVPTDGEKERRYLLELIARIENNWRKEEIEEYRMFECLSSEIRQN
jgi:hypothetical protein